MDKTTYKDKIMNLFHHRNQLTTKHLDNMLHLFLSCDMHEFNEKNSDTCCLKRSQHEVYDLCLVLLTFCWINNHIADVIGCKLKSDGFIQLFGYWYM